MNDAVQVRDLKKNFKVAKTGRGGPLAKLKQFIHPLHESLNAVDDISFAIRRGEKVAFIGPNGAGKSTTIKLLTGIFQPCAGFVRIFDQDPYIDRKNVAYKIGTVFGQRSQLWYHLPAYHSFKLLGTIYDIDRKKFKERLNHLIEIVQLSPFISRPIKELSLGERMRCELEATTIFLTSHDIADIEKVCDRIILINKGKIIVDDSVKSIKKRYLKNKVITMKSEEKLEWRFHPAISLVHERDSFYKFEIDLNLMNPQEAVRYFAQNYRFTDIVIEDPPLEEIIKGIYQS